MFIKFFDHENIWLDTIFVILEQDLDELYSFFSLWLMAEAHKHNNVIFTTFLLMDFFGLLVCYIVRSQDPIAS